MHVTVAQHSGLAAARPNIANGTLASLILVPMSSVAATAPLNLAETANFDIPAAPLVTALLQFSDQAHVQIASSGLEVGEEHSPGAVGEMAIGAALSKLLTGTGFTFQVSGARSIAVFLRDQPVNAARADVRADAGAQSTGSNGAGQQQAPATPRRGALARIAGVIGSIAAAVLILPAHAQQSGSTGATVQLEEIVVTAEKRRVNIQDAPSAITSVSGDELQELGFQNIVDMSGLFPSARFEPTGFVTHLYVRGIGAEQDRIAVDQLVNMSLDGVLLPREMDSVPVSDVNDVELLPGPQGTLYGASSVGGVLTIQNNRPTDDVYNKLILEAGNYGEFHVADVQNARVNNKFALRGSVNYMRHSAYQNTGAWTADAINARLGLLYTPSDAFSAYVWGFVHNDHGIPQNSGTLTTTGEWIPADDPWDSKNSCISGACNGLFSRPNNGPGKGDIHDYIVAGQFDWHLDGLTITDIPSVLHNESRQFFYAFIFPSNYNVTNHQVTNELRVSNDAGSPLQWLAGLYLYRNKAEQFFDLAGYSVPDYTVENVAPYAQLTYAVNSTFRATAGARYSWTSKEATFILPNPLPESSATWSSVDWKAGIEYDVSPSTLTYVTAQTGSSPGTLDAQNPVSGHPAATKLTKLYSLTAGWKSRLLDNRLQLNNEVFYYDYHDFLIQTIVCGSATCFPLKNVFINAPKLTSWGDQLDLRWLVTQNDQVTLNAAYTNAKTGHWVTDAGANLSDQTLMEAPETTITAGLQHVFGMQSGGSTVLNLNSSIVSGYFGDFGTQPGTPVHSPVLHQHSYSTTGVTLTYHSPKDTWTLGLWGRNLENKGQIGPGAVFNFGPVNGVIPFGGAAPIATAPRTFGIRFTVNLEPSAPR